MYHTYVCTFLGGIFLGGYHTYTPPPAQTISLFNLHELIVLIYIQLELWGLLASCSRIRKPSENYDPSRLHGVDICFMSELLCLIGDWIQKIYIYIFFLCVFLD